MPTESEKASGRPKSQPVYDLLRERLESGAFEPDSLLPTEEELQAELGVSRYALREALAQLERQRYIERRRRAGTRVLTPPSKHVFRHATSSRVELMEFVHHTTIDFSPPELVETDGRLARELGCDEMRRWNRMEGIRIDPTDNTPIGVVQLYVDAARAPITAKTDFGNRLVYQWLEEKHGIRAASISQDISAVLLSEKDAEVMNERVGAPALRIARRYFDDKQRIFQISVTTHRAKNFIYNIRLQLD